MRRGASIVGMVVIETTWDGYGRVCGQHTRNMNICYGPFVGSASRLSEFGVQHIRWLFMCVINLFLCVYNMMQALVHVYYVGGVCGSKQYGTISR